MGTLSTYFAPAERADAAALRKARESFLANRVAVTMLDGIPDMTIVLNRNRQIIAANQRLLQTLGVADPEALVGLRPGEAAGCLHAADEAGGCGTSKYCLHCGAVNAIMDCLNTRATATRECRILTHAGGDGGALDLNVEATFLNVARSEFIVVAMRDTSAEKRRSVLERVFFHDVLNTASGIQAITQLMDDPDEDPAQINEYKNDLRILSQQIIEEISAQRQLLAAEQGELKLNRSETPVREILLHVQAFYRHHNLARFCRIELGDCPDSHLTVDAMILRRILGNLVKNALEATEPGGTVTLSAVEQKSDMAFYVHNPGVMPEEIQHQIFQRSFSTKGGIGRGVGTYSVKLFTERYLGGLVSFTSATPDGTTFCIVLPNYTDQAV